jgi:hypothetical protein
MTIRSKMLRWPRNWKVSPLVMLRTFYHSWTIFWLTPLQLTESDADLNTLKVMVDNAVAFFYPGESSFGVCAPQMLDSLLTRSREIILANMRQSVSLTLRILKSRYTEPTWTQWRGLRGDLQWWRSLKAHRGHCCNGGIGCWYVRSRHVPRVDYDVIKLSDFESFLQVAILSWMEVIRASSWPVLLWINPLNYFFWSILLLKPKTDIIRLTSFLREFLSHLTMIKSHAGSTFYTLCDLSIRVLPSY